MEAEGANAAADATRVVKIASFMLMYLFIIVVFGNYVERRKQTHLIDQWIRKNNDRILLDAGG